VHLKLELTRADPDRLVQSRSRLGKNHEIHNRPVA